MQGGRRRGAACALALAALWGGGQARAQSSAAAVPEDRRERIEVTGSRIITIDVDSPSPITVITGAEIVASGHTSLEMILNDYPQLIADQGARVSNGATGTAAANLRGLLPGRTLVLVNGRRMLSGSPFLLAPDLNQIPVHLISRVEILTGGASAVYGSDAIAGVVNVILKDRFEGVEGSIAHDFYMHRQKNGFSQELGRQAGFALPGDKSHDGATTSANLTLGGVFAHDRGHAAASLRYIKSEALLQSERDYSACSPTWFDFGTPEAAVACGGSPTSYPGRFIDVATGRRLTIADASGNIRPFVIPLDLYNFAPTNYYQRPTERYGFDAFGRYEIGPDTRVYAELGFHDDRTLAQIAPSGIFGGIQVVHWENPLLGDTWRSRLTFTRPDGTRGGGPGATAQVVIQRRNVEGGGRQFDFGHTSFRELVGVRATAWEAWEIDAFYQAAKVIASQISTNEFSISRFSRALNVVPDPVTGTPVCAARLDGSDPGCVPYNPWRLDGVTPEALAYLQIPAFQSGYTSQSLASVSARANLERYGVRLPWAQEAVEVAFGFEHRSDAMTLATDPLFASGDRAGGAESVPSVEGRVSVKELFSEVRVPLHDKISLVGAYRFSDYSTGPRTHTFGLGFNAVPTPHVRLRGSFQKAVRAANIVELFTPQITSEWFYVPDDPCAGPTPRFSPEQCRRTGVTAARYGNIPLVPGGLGFPALLGGNPELQPEKAKTATLGIGITPARSVSATLDYYDIRVTDFIDKGDPQENFDRCVETGDARFCDLIRRDPVSGSLWLDPARVVAINRNIGRVRASGVDLGIDYRSGAFAVSAVGSYIRAFTVENYPGAKLIECAGNYTHCGEPRPRWRHRARVAWKTPWDVEVSASWRYLHSIADPDGRLPELAAVNYFDLGLSWALDKRLRVQLAVQNVADRDPPLTVNFPPFGNGNTFAQTYDALGRHVSLGLNARF